MRIVRVGANDPLFRTVNFRPGAGLNLLLADKTRPAGVGDSRNGTGKSSLILIIRYLLGGNKPASVAKDDSFKDFEFYGLFETSPSSGADPETFSVRRNLQSNRINVSGWSVAPDGEYGSADWSLLLGQYFFDLPEGLGRPTVSQLVSQFARNAFDPTKLHAAEADWETGCRYAFLFGLDADLAANAGEVARLERQQKALKQAARDGVVADLRLDVAALRGQLITIMRQRDEAAAELSAFRVEERYQDHQARADALGAQIQHLNERELISARKLRDLERAIGTEAPMQQGNSLADGVRAVFDEAGVTFTAHALQRFEDVLAFHESVIRNRRIFLEDGAQSARADLDEIRRSRTRLDGERASLLVLLSGTVAFETYSEAQRSVGELDAEIAAITERLGMAQRLDNIGEVREVKAVESRRLMRLEVAQQETGLDEARALFGSLAAEVYGHSAKKKASLDLGVGPKHGSFLVNPEISADGSTGIASVKTFIMDMVTVVMATKTGHSPGFLIHDSVLFDSVDSEQVASCLNIGARLAEEYGFQYIVTMNSDKLRSVIEDSNGAFDDAPYALSVRLSDASNELRLFGRQFA